MLAKIQFRLLDFTPLRYIKQCPGLYQTILPFSLFLVIWHGPCSLGVYGYAFDAPTSATVWSPRQPWSRVSGRLCPASFYALHVPNQSFIDALPNVVIQSTQLHNSVELTITYVGQRVKDPCCSSRPVRFPATRITLFKERRKSTSPKSFACLVCYVFHIHLHHLA